MILPPALEMLGYVGAAANVLTGVPQLARVRRDGPSGLSPLSLLTWLACNLAWAAWAVAVGDVPVMLSCGFGSVAPLLVSALAVRDGHVPAHAVAAAAAAAALLPVYTPVALAGWLAAAASLTYNIPQVTKLLRSSDVNGLSIGRYGFEQTRILCWIAYGTAAGLAPLVVTSVLQLVPVLVITALIVAHRRRVALDLASAS